MIKPKKAPYASTVKDPDSSIADINRMLRTYGIDNYQWTTLWNENRVELRFAIELEVGRKIGILVRPPPFTSKHRTWNAKKGRNEIVEAPNWPQCMRLLFWWLKAKVEAVAYGLREVEEEFLSDVIVKLPTGEETTVGEAMRPALAAGSNSVLDVPRLQAGKTRTIEATDVEAHQKEA